MNKITALFIALQCVFFAFSQQDAPPQGINYQAVAIDKNGKEIVGTDITNQPVSNQEIRVRFSILKTDANGTLVYREVHLTQTDNFGLFNVIIGQGIQDASPAPFDQIDWGSGYHFLKVEMDIKGGTDFVDMGTNQLWSVPYSLHSKHADSAGNGIDSVSDNGNGSITFTYIDGSTYTTPVLTGLTGPQGPQGAPGTNGQNGASAYETWLALGNTGTQADFITAITGATGQQGIQGPTGLTGSTGAQGVAGTNGTNGTNGIDGKNTLTKTTTEAAGANCSTGGVKLEYGLDANSNGTLDLSEINATLTKYVCNGATGATGAQGVQGVPGPTGATGLTGAQGVAGTNGTNGTNGIDGKNTLTKTTTEAAGANCTTGGVKLEYGLDANGNGTLDLSEINATLTKYVCNGTVGVTGPTGATGAQGIAGTNGTNGANGIDGKNTLTKTTTEAAGANCTTGGVKLEYGLDANSNGTLDVSEINAALTIYVCNGAVGLTGATGAQGIAGTNGLDGAIGPQGPVGLTGANGAQGLPGTNGTNGLNALIKTTAEAAGANCANGGTKIETGLDANANGTLDASEVNAIQTRYVCNGNVTSGTQTLSINGVNTTQYVPDYLYNTGNCASGSLSTTGNFTLNSTYAEYCNLKINSGHTFNLPYQGLNGWNSGKGITVTILVKDTLVINGIINGVPTGTHNPFVFGGDLNTAGGPGGSSSKVIGSTTGVNSLIEWDSYNSSNGILPPTYSMTITGGSGCTTVTPPNNITVSALQEAIKIKSQLGGVAGQGSDPNGYSLTPYNNGGYGGTGLYVICRVLVFNGQINLKGSNGTSSYSGAGVNVYGGGGGGGSLVISAETILQNTGAINLSGGTGISTSSPTYCDSSAGGSGAYIIIDR